MDLKNEVAGVTFLFGLAALLLALLGPVLLVGSLLSVAVGSVVVRFLPEVLATGTTMAVTGAGMTTVGIAGLLVVWAAVGSGYFEPADRATPDADDDANGGTDVEEDLAEEGSPEPFTEESTDASTEDTPDPA